MVKIMAKTHWKLGTFLLLLALAVVGAAALMPAEKVHAYVPPSTGQVSGYGSLTVVVVYEDGEPATKAEFKVERAWQEAVDTTEGQYLEDKSDSIEGFQDGALGVPYLDYVVKQDDPSNPYWGMAFGIVGENEAKITLKETTPPSDGYGSQDDIVIDYSYEGLDGTTTIKERDFGDRVVYGLKVSVSGGTDVDLTVEDYVVDPDEPIIYPVTYTLTITYSKDQGDTGNLKVSNVLEGNDTDPDKEFSYTVKLSDTTISGTFDGMTFTDGVATFKLKGGESALAKDLPSDITYTVTQEAEDGYTTTKTGDTGSIPTSDGTAECVFTNTKNKSPEPAPEPTPDPTPTPTPTPTPGVEYKITYKLNGGSFQGSTADIVETYADGTSIKIHEAPVREGYEFQYWEGSEYQPGDNYTVTGDHVFTAQWKEKAAPAKGTVKTADATPIASLGILVLIAGMLVAFAAYRRARNS